MSNAPFLSSDPNAFLRSYWQDLHRQSTFFANLAPELQAEALAAAVEREHPSKAIEIRQWNPSTRRAMIAVLDQALRERHADRTSELWRVRRGDRELVCVAVYVSCGVDLRLLEAGGIRRTELYRDAPSLRRRADAWRVALAHAGWEPITVVRPSETACPAADTP